MPDRLERLYDEHAQALFSFLVHFTRSETDTRDVLQEVFCEIARRPSLLEGLREERAFLLRLARNRAVDLMRRRTTRDKKHAQLANEPRPVYTELPAADGGHFQNALEVALESLPPEQRAVVHLKLWEEATFEAIAETLGISANTAASRYRYAIDKLRDRLRPLYEEIKHDERI
jgi:RNA polymerase sigma-70 factor, ECF subfamily